MDILNPIFTEKTECQDCYKCVRECPVKAIKIENGHAEVIKEQCIYCGHCVEICPSGAKRVRNDLGRVKQLLKLKERVIVSLAPSYISEFNEYSCAQIIYVIKKLGFFGVSETALGAQEVSASSAELVKSSKGRIFISSACPTVVEYLSKYKPLQSYYITNLLSPVLAHCKLLKREYGDDIGVVFIGPCISKKRESDAHQELLDVAITFEDLRAWIAESGIKPNLLPEDVNEGFIPEQALEGALYPIDGGMVAGIKANCSVNDACFMVFSGIGNIENALQDIEKMNVPKNIFLELLSCEGGCVNGPKACSKTATAMKRLNVIDNAAYPDKEIPRKPTVDITDQIKAQPIDLKEFDESEMRAILKTIGKYSIKDELNCGGCGYDSCRDFARALLDGKAEHTMCVSYMRKLAQNKANALIKSMPSGVVIVNDNLKIIECNRNFARLFGTEIEMIYDAAPGLEGMPLDRILPFTNLFQHVLETGEDIVNRNVNTKNAVLNASIVTVDKHRIIGGIFQDVTEPSVRKQQIVNKTKQVIRKNLQTVQKIAYLLGENAAETEVILNSITDSFFAKPTDDETDTKND
ncbi:MAG: [Fe-Fe] hydrogenase large subunit C-terminal domain-containing protein [Candidatus Auribacterota bacterium]